MSKEGMQFTIAALFIVGAVTAVILYQHSVHTGIVLDTLAGSGAVGSPVGREAPSTATGVWTPLGPTRDSIFPYQPSTNLATPYAPPSNPNASMLAYTGGLING